MPWFQQVTDDINHILGLQMILPRVSAVTASTLFQILQISGPAASPVYTLRLLRASATACRREMRRGTVGRAIGKEEVWIGASVMVMIVTGTRYQLGGDQWTQGRAGGSQSLRSVGVVGHANVVPQSAQRKVSHTLNAIVDLVQLLQVLLCEKTNRIARVTLY